MVNLHFGILKVANYIMNNGKFTKETIAICISMRKQGSSIKLIQAETGMGKSAVHYHTNAIYRLKHLAATRKYQKDNPDKFRLIIRKAVKKYLKTEKGQVAAKKHSKLDWQKLKSDPEKLRKHNERSRFLAKIRKSK